MLTSCFLAKEKNREEQIDLLKKQLEKAQKDLKANKASSSTAPYPDPFIQKERLTFEIPTNIENIQEDWELPKDAALEELSQHEIELAALIKE